MITSINLCFIEFDMQIIRIRTVGSTFPSYQIWSLALYCVFANCKSLSSQVL